MGYICNPHYSKLIRINTFNYYVNENLTKVNLFIMLFMLNIDGLITIDINLNN